jgi:hypothetical protein
MMKTTMMERFRLMRDLSSLLPRAVTPFRSTSVTLDEVDDVPLVKTLPGLPEACRDGPEVGPSPRALACTAPIPLLLLRRPMAAGGPLK